MVGYNANHLHQTILIAVFFAALTANPGALSQVAAGGPASASTATTSPTSAPPVRHRRSHPRANASSGSTVIGLQPDATADQKAAYQRVADQRLLSQQQAQSQAAQQVNNQLTRQKMIADKRVANEVRIQDAPGPAQTGVVPGSPVQAVSPDDQPRIQDAPGPPATTAAPAAATQTPRIQDAPGPAQTIPTIPPPSPNPEDIPGTDPML